jgi:hypothetical protein
MEGAPGAGADVFGRDPWGIPGIYLSFTLSLLALVVGSYLWKPPTAAELEPFFGKGSSGPA